jgi:PhoH-like ATPase
MKKQFVLDTNVLLHSSDCIFDFGDNEVVLPIEVIEELDRFKRQADEKGRSARQIIRTLDGLRKQGRLGDGVEMENGGILRVLVLDTSKERIEGLSKDVMDNKILMAAHYLKTHGNNSVIFVSKDINARIKADAIGLQVMDYEKQKVNFDEIYSGWRTIDMTTAKIDAFFKDGTLNAPGDEEMSPNEFVLLTDSANPKHTAIGKYRNGMGEYVPLFHGKAAPWGVKPRNMEQRFAMELLLCDEVKLVTLMGSAGTGKTLLALAAGLGKVMDEKVYKKLLVTRPIIPFGRDIGYLPGDKDEKMRNWMQPIYDNLQYLIGSDGKDSDTTIHYLMNAKGPKTIEVEALTYIRGRSIPNQYMIVDEAQNLTPHEVKTIISRAGEGTKIILTGDPYQIDSPYLDASSNGLSYVIDRFKGQPLFGHVTLTRSERSELASVAANIL